MTQRRGEPVIERVRGWLRVRHSPDLTLLGPRTRRYWHAHVRWIALYGFDNWKRYAAKARRRHAERLAEGRVITEARNYTGNLFLDAPEVKR